MPQLLLIALATLVTEDLTCIATGVLVAQRRLDFFSGSLACVAGIYFGDLLLFLTGRFVGRPALRRSLFRRFVSEEQLDRASAWLSSKGAAAVFLSRFAPGLRLPTYFAAGVLKTKFWTFAAYFLLAAAIWTPLLIGLTVALGGQAARSALLTGGRGSVAIVALAALWLGLRKLAPVLFGFRVRRRIAGFLKRKVRWEFWPPWVAYLPLIPYLAWLTVRYRCATVFTLANPGIPSGGFAGESKSQILSHLEGAEGMVASFAMIPGSLEPHARITKAIGFFEQHGSRFPVVLKPDIGERGSGVAIVRSRSELECYLREAENDTIIQEYIEGVEFGVFYYRHPNESAGHIFSITEKRFPEVTGNGRSTFEELVLGDARAVCLAGIYLGRGGRAADSVPAAGERVRLAELGSHCRGAVFLDGMRFKTSALEAAIDRISKQHPGFFFGRFDIRAATLQDFQDGRFRVIELNGVTSEATHIYDPVVSLLDAYGALFTQWRIAFEIGAENRALGATPMPAADVLRLAWRHLRRAPSRGGPNQRPFMLEPRMRAGSGSAAIPPDAGKAHRVGTGM